MSEVWKNPGRAAIGGLVLAIGLAMTGCTDARRAVISTAITTNPPQHFEIVSIGKKYEITTPADGHARAEVPVILRSTIAAIEPVDGFATGQGRALVERLDAVKTWSETDVPADDPARARVLALWTPARQALPLKRIVASAGTEVEGSASVDLTKGDAGWAVSGVVFQPPLGGLPDTDGTIPVEASPGAQAAYDELALVAKNLEALRRDWLGARELRAAESLRTMRGRLRTGNLYRGTLGGPDGPAIRLVISRGLDRSDAVIGVIKDVRRDQSSVRYEGRLRQLPSGDFVWAAERTATIALAAGAPAFFSRSATPASLTLRVEGEGLAADEPRMTLSLTGRFDVIPEP